MKFAQPLFVVLLAAQVSPAADQVLTDYLPSGVKIVFGVQVRKIIDSPLAQGALTQAKAQAQAASVSWMKAAQVAGFDPSRDLDEILVATNGEGDNPPALIVVSGRFDLGKLAEGATRYKSIPLLGGGDKASDGVIALVDDHIALAGDRPMVLAAIDRIGEVGKPAGAMIQRIGSMREKYDIWGIGDRLEGLGPASAAGNGLDSIDRFQLGLSLHDGLELGAEFHARSPQDVEKLNATLGMLGMMMKAQTSSGAKFDVQTDNGTFKLTASVPEAELKKALEAQSGLIAKMLEENGAKAGIAVTSEAAEASSTPMTLAAKPERGAVSVEAATGATVSAPEEPAKVEAAPAAPTVPAVPAAQASPAAPAVPGAMKTANGASVLMDKDGNAVVVHLPGAKK